MSRPIEAIIFDFFGVIITDALSALCNELVETDPAAVQELRSLIHAANKGVIDPTESSERAAQTLGLTLDEYRARIRDGETVDRKLLAYIKDLRRDYKTALLSNITKSGLERRFPNNALNEYFDEIVVSSDIGYAKPEIEAYQIAAERLGLPMEACVFLDDREGYCEAAQAVGMQAIVYESLPQAKHELQQILTRI